MAGKQGRKKKIKMTKNQRIRAGYQNQIINLTQVLMEKFLQPPPNYVVSADLKTLPTEKLKGLRDALQRKLEYLVDKAKEAIAKERDESIKAGLMCCQCSKVITQSDMDDGVATVDLCKNCMEDF